MTLNPVTLDARPLYHAPPGTLLAASVAVHVRNTLYVGSARGYRLLEIDIPAVAKTHVKEKTARKDYMAGQKGKVQRAHRAGSGTIVSAVRAAFPVTSRDAKPGAE